MVVRALVGSAATAWSPPPIDVCTPTQFIDGIWTYDDLELDLVKSRDGSWQLIDQDEFDDEVRRGSISTEESAASLAAVSELGSRLDQFDKPFDVKGWDLLDAAGKKSSRRSPN